MHITQLTTALHSVYHWDELKKTINRIRLSVRESFINQAQLFINWECALTYTLALEDLFLLHKLSRKVILETD